MHEDIRRIRDLISSGPMHRVLRADPLGWNRFCDALDALSDRPDLQGRHDALDTLREILRLDASPDIDRTDAALAAGIAAVRVELESQANSHRETFAGKALMPLIADESQLGYALEKIATGLRGYLPGDEHHSDAGTRAMGRAGVEALERAVRGVDDGLRARGHDEWVRSDCDDLLYMIERVRLFFAGSPDAPTARDAYLLAALAMPEALTRVRKIAAEVDTDDTSPVGGWMPPTAPNDA